jgi:hypothetical protein
MANVNSSYRHQRRTRLTKAGYYWAVLSVVVIAAGFALGALPGLVIATELVSLALLVVILWSGIGK